jgi:acyl-CoA thioesterase YciA
MDEDSVERTPRGSLSIRTLAMPADTNQYGDIFGGWLLGQMDIAGGIFAAGTTQGRTATIAVDAMTFRKPVFVGDVMCIYTDLIRIGITSITVHVEAWVILTRPRASSSPTATLPTLRSTKNDARAQSNASKVSSHAPSNVLIEGRPPPGRGKCQANGK